ncbi:MAG TPA: hypothetical protein VHB21_20615 [Minicystis sp.]|nr:hypothetical protein [Minicystis sp.]
MMRSTRSVLGYALLAALAVTAGSFAACGDDAETTGGGGNTTSDGAGASGTGTAGSTPTSGTSNASGGSTGTSGTTPTSTANASGGSTPTGTGGAGGAGTGGAGGAGGTMNVCSQPPGATINGCAADGSDAIDSGGATATITFAFPTYTPRCTKVHTGNSGATVTFTGDFLSHPLAAGEIRSSTACPADPNADPLSFSSPSETTHDFVLTTPGTYPFYCANHGPSFDMDGVVFVVSP